MREWVCDSPGCEVRTKFALFYICILPQILTKTLKSFHPAQRKDIHLLGLHPSSFNFVLIF